MKARRVSLLALLLLSAGAASAQDVHPVTGRRIAPVMGVSGADWLQRPERELEENPEAALKALNLKPGMMVADIGAGSGYFTIRIAQRVGPTGRVYGEDIQPEMLSLLRDNAAKAKVENVIPVLGAEADPKLPPKSLDLVLMVDVYHEFSQPQRMLDHIRNSLKPDGRLVLVEYRKEDPAIPIRAEHKMSVSEVKAEVEPEGYKLDKVIEDLPRQHILVFKKNVM